MIINTGGTPGPQGVGITNIIQNADYSLTIELTNGDSYTTDPVRGPIGPPGKGISSVTLNPDYTITITYTDGDPDTFGPIRGEKGESGVVVNTGILLSAGWVGNTQTISVQGVSPSKDIVVSADPASIIPYYTARIYCTVVGEDELTFVCTTEPTVDLTVNVAILG